MPGGPISLATAIDEIKAELNARETEAPFFLMVGAGVFRLPARLPPSVRNAGKVLVRRPLE